MEFPPIEERDRQMISFWRAAGSAGSGHGFGLVALSWSDIYAWSRLVEAPLLPWHYEALRMMSQAYAGEFNSASKESTPPPWMTEEARMTKKETEIEATKTFFRSMIASRKEKEGGHGE